MKKLITILTIVALALLVGRVWADPLSDICKGNKYCTKAHLEGHEFFLSMEINPYTLKSFASGSTPMQSPPEPSCRERWKEFYDYYATHHSSPISLEPDCQDCD